MNPALRVSLEALEACELGWPRSLQKLDLERAQRGLPRSLRPRVTELVSSCLRQRRSLRLIVGHCLRRSLKKAKPRLAATLQLATLLQLRQDPDAIKLRKAAPSRKIKERLDRLEGLLTRESWFLQQGLRPIIIDASQPNQGSTPR